VGKLETRVERLEEKMVPAGDDNAEAIQRAVIEALGREPTEEERAIIAQLGRPAPVIFTDREALEVVLAAREKAGVGGAVICLPDNRRGGG